MAGDVTSMGDSHVCVPAPMFVDEVELVFSLLLLLKLMIAAITTMTITMMIIARM